MNTRAYKLLSRFRDLLAYTEARVADLDRAVKVLQTCMKQVLEAESALDSEQKIFSWCCSLIDNQIATTPPSTNGAKATFAP